MYGEKNYFLFIVLLCYVLNGKKVCQNPKDVVQFISVKMLGFTRKYCLEVRVKLETHGMILAHSFPFKTYNNSTINIGSFFISY